MGVGAAGLAGQLCSLQARRGVISKLPQALFAEPLLFENLYEQVFRPRQDFRTLLA